MTGAFMFAHLSLLGTKEVSWMHTHDVHVSCATSTRSSTARCARRRLAFAVPGHARFHRWSSLSHRCCGGIRIDAIHTVLTEARCFKLQSVHVTLVSIDRRSRMRSLLCSRPQASTSRCKTTITTYTLQHAAVADGRVVPHKGTSRLTGGWSRRRQRHDAPLHTRRTVVHTTHTDSKTRTRARSGNWHDGRVGTPTSVAGAPWHL